MTEQISIHAPREGSDVPRGHGGLHHGGISIHAPREGSDLMAMATAITSLSYFNPRSPRGERPS